VLSEQMETLQNSIEERAKLGEDSGRNADEMASLKEENSKLKDQLEELHAAASILSEGAAFTSM
jgi:hypothetical protein